MGPREGARSLGRGLEKDCLLWRLLLTPSCDLGLPLYLSPPPPGGLLLPASPPAGGSWRCLIPFTEGPRSPLQGWEKGAHWRGGGQGLFRYPLHHFLIEMENLRATPSSHALGCWRLSPATLRDGWVFSLSIPLSPHNLSPGKMSRGKSPQRAGP